MVFSLDWIGCIVHALRATLGGNSHFGGEGSMLGNKEKRLHWWSALAVVEKQKRNWCLPIQPNTVNADHFGTKDWVILDVVYHFNLSQIFIFGFPFKSPLNINFTSLQKWNHNSNFCTHFCLRGNLRFQVYLKCFLNLQHWVQGTITWQKFWKNMVKLIQLPSA